MSLAAAVAAVACSLPPAYVPPASPLYEVPEARQERLTMLGGAIAAAAHRARCAPPWDEIDTPCRRRWPGSAVELSAVLLGLAYLESGLAWHVHAGQCRTEQGECDAGRARSPWQLQRTGHVWRHWDELEGVGEWSTFRAAWGATLVVSSARRFCSRHAPEQPWIDATVAAYARGYTCTWSRSPRRAQFVVSVEQRIREALAERD